MWQFITDVKSRDFFRFWFAQLVSQLGDRIYQMALVGLIAIRHPGSVVEMSKLLVFTILPVFIVGPIAGVYIDRWDRRTVLFTSYFIQGVLVFLAAFWLIHLPSIWPMYAVVFIIYSLSRFYVPAKMSFLPEIVHDEDLHIANSLTTITGMIALVLGAPLGGVIVEYSGSFGGFCWDAGCYLLAAFFLFSIATLNKRFPDKARIIGATRELLRHERSVWRQILDGIRYIRSQKEIAFIVWMTAILFAAVGAIYVVIIVFIQQAFHSITEDLGFLAVALGIGLFLGSLAFGKWGKAVSTFKVIFWSLILGGAMVVIFTAAVGTTHNRLVALGLAWLLGLLIGPVMVAPNTVVNKICAAQMSGKVFAALEFVLHLAFLVAMMASSFLSQYVARFWILVSVGCIFTLVGIAGLIKFEPKQGEL